MGLVDWHDSHVTYNELVILVIGGLAGACLHEIFLEQHF